MRAMLRLRRRTKDSVRKVVMVTEDDAQKLLVTPRLCISCILALNQSSTPK